jgi:hypothetical protein
LLHSKTKYLLGRSEHVSPGLYFKSSTARIRTILSKRSLEIKKMCINLLWGLQPGSIDLSRYHIDLRNFEALNNFIIYFF